MKYMVSPFDIYTIVLNVPGKAVAWYDTYMPDISQ